MITSDRLVTIYTNARELVKQNQPKAAKAYVGLLLKVALQSYHSASSIMMQAKTREFMIKWIAVANDLQEYGVTDYVLACFGLPFHAEKDFPVDKSLSPAPPSPKPDEREKAAPAAPSPDNGIIDVSGLIDDVEKTQGWCADVFEKNKTAVVEISVSSPGVAGSGTGFVISVNGYLLTNHHVVCDERDGSYHSKIKMNRIGEKKEFSLKVLFSDKKADIALCRFDPKKVDGLTSVKRIADYSELKQGADCLVIGNAFGRGLAPFTGIVRFTEDDDGDLVYTAPSNPGDSGGPVFNRRGEAIGINKSKTLSFDGTEADGYANATPMSVIDSFLEKWTKDSDIEL